MLENPVKGYQQVLSDMTEIYQQLPYPCRQLLNLQGEADQIGQINSQKPFANRESNNGR